MAYRMTIPGWPDTLNAISWSEDNLIAVASGESVALLSPRLHDFGPDGMPWTDTLFKINAFTVEEVPRSDPLSFQKFSLGEELSLRHVQALEWSSPGLARHRRCVLAVLSSNHVLSLWEHDGRPDVGTNWKRKVIVNHALRKHYDGLGRTAGESQQDLHERKQVQQRVRAFVWSSPVHKNSDEEDERSTRYVDADHQSLAVATEAEEILILRVRSPHNILCPKITEWNIEVVHSLDLRTLVLEALHPRLPGDGSDMHLDNDGRFIAHHIAWGSWGRSKDGTGTYATLAFISNGRLFCVEMDEDVWTKQPDTRKVHHCEARNLIQGRSDMIGPLKFIPKTTSLTAFATDEVYCVDTSVDPVNISGQSFHHLDGQWDEMSGVALTYSGKDLPRMHVASHLSSSTTSTTSLSLPLHEDEMSMPPSWQNSIKESKAAYSAQHNLDDHVFERTWGIAASPMGEYIATASSMLPSDSVAYVVPGDQRTIINITDEVDREQCGVLPPNEGVDFQTDVTAELMLFNLQRYLERQSDPAEAEVLVRAMLTAVNAPQEQSSYESEFAPSPVGYETCQIVRYLRTQMFMRPEMMKERFRLLADIALRRASNANQNLKLIIENLVATVLRLPSNPGQGSELSGKLRKAYAMVQSKIQSKQQSDMIETDGGPWSEECRVCHSDLPFESVKWARCESGHHFSRCALTFFAIQGPGISKHCTICRSQFLNEWALPGFVAFSWGVDVDMEDLPVEEDALPPDAFPDKSRGPNDDVQPLTERRQGQVSLEGVGQTNHNIQEEQLAPEDGCVQIVRSGTAAIEPPDSLARILFAAFDICVYCGGKFVA